MNQCNFAGRLGHDAHVAYAPSGDAITELSLAVDVYKRGEKSTLWVKAKIWGERGQKVAGLLTKGSALAVSGRVEVEAWKSREGEPKAGLVLWVNDFTILHSTAERAPPAERDRTEPSSSRRSVGGPAPKAGAAAPGSEDYDDDIPF